uniref:Transmembrane protein 225 domain-containing protein n=1 Tax=Spermophilus dauricus TaxID=99837 RepID=A0A8C9Q0T3_SPEDA
IMPVSSRHIQATNILVSSWVVLFLIVGVILEEWIKLTINETTDNQTTNKTTDETIHNPWMTCCTAVWPEDGLKIIRIMMLTVLITSCTSNFILGLLFTYIIPQNKYVYLIIFLFSILLFCALLLYDGMLRKGKTVYFSSFKITWVAATAYFTIILLLACRKCFCDSSFCTCLKIQKSAKDLQLSGSSIQVISLPERTVMPRSIVRVHSHNSKEDTANRSHVQARRVTWAL